MPSPRKNRGGSYGRQMATKAKKRRFNVVDALIIVLVLAVIAVAVWLVVWRKNVQNAEESFDIEYIVELRTIRDEFTDNFKVGDKLIDSASKLQLGEIIATNITPATFTGTNYETGSLAYYDYPEHSDVALTVKATATLNSDGEYLIDHGFVISVGETVYVRLPGYVGVGYCTQLKKTEAR